MARDRGFLLSDKITPCNVAWNSSLQSLARARPHDYHSTVTFDGQPERNTNQCIIYILGTEINTASFAMYTFSVSVFIQAILIISMSGAADHGNYRKMLLTTFAFIGSISTMLFLLVVPTVYLLGSLLAIIANTCFGASFVLLNSFLPLLVRYHPALLTRASERFGTGTDTDRSRDCRPFEDHNPELVSDDATSPLLRACQTDRRGYETVTGHRNVDCVSGELKLSTEISSYGIGIGYIGAVILQIVSIIVVVRTHRGTFSLRLVLFLIGLWWFVFSIPAIIWLRSRSGSPLPFTHDGKRHPSLIDYIVYAWKSLGRTARHTRQLKDILLFLAAWFLLSDSIATVSGTAVLFAKTQLNMQPAALGLINVIAMAAGVLGAFSWGHISQALNLQASQTIIACVVLFELVPIYGLLGFIPAIKDMGFLGLQRPWEMFPLGAVYGLVMGGLSSYCRSFFGELIPPGYEAAFYSLYAITDKGSSIFGPAIVGAITDHYGEIRPAFVFLAILIILPLPLMLLVDVDRGKRDALALALELGGRSADETLSYRTTSHTQSSDEAERMISE